MIQVKSVIMMTIAVCLCICLYSQAISASNSPNKYNNNSNLNSSDASICEKQTHGFETALGIPRHLLTAISLTESGKWDKKNKALVAWPWTIMAMGKGHYLRTKQAAIKKVIALKAQGVKNIDVGCMQINLFYHPNAFENLEAAFDPERNVGYAANFLAALNQSTRSWSQATANYHSTRVSKNRRYLNKVLTLWKKVSKRKLKGSIFRASPDPVYSDPKARSAQMAVLKSRFRARLQAERSAKKPEKKKHNLDAWRNGKFDTGLLKAAIAKQRGDRVRADKEYLNKGKKSFKSRRKSQLARWRRTREGSSFRN